MIQDIKKHNAKKSLLMALAYGDDIVSNPDIVSDERLYRLANRWIKRCLELSLEKQTEILNGCDDDKLRKEHANSIERFLKEVMVIKKEPYYIYLLENFNEK